MIETFGKFIATTPMQTKNVTLKVSKGFGVAEQTVTLAALEVIFPAVVDGRKFAAKDKIYVRAESYAFPWAKIVYELNGSDFILVPVDAILLQETNDEVLRKV